MDKKETTFNGSKYWLLLKDKQGVYHWLKEPSWDCGWYWGLGYVVTFTNNRHPQRSIDIKTHNFFDKLYLDDESGILEFLHSDSPLNDKERWQILGLMQSCYALKNIAEIFGRGGSNFSDNPCRNLIKDDEKVKDINEVVLPEMFMMIKSILVPTSKNN